MQKKGSLAGSSKAKTTKELDPTALRAAMMRRVARRASASGEIVLPAAPGLLEQYVTMLDTIFRALGRVFSPEELDHARKVLKAKLDEGWAHSRGCTIVVSYETNKPPAVSLNYRVGLRKVSMEEQYSEWITTLEPPLFGTHPDARVLAVAEKLGPPAQAPVLDVGAGTGRNSLPLARRGHPVDAVEVTPQFADVLRADAQKEGLPVRVLNVDATSPSTRFERKYRLVFLSEVVSDMRSLEQVRRVFSLASEALVPGGYLLFNAFVAVNGYTPDAMARDFSQVVWSSAFTRNDLNQASSGLGFTLEADDPVFEYEKDNLPAEAWPPKGWYPEWVNGQDIFDLPEGRCPIDMRWLLFRRG